MDSTEYCLPPLRGSYGSAYADRPGSFGSVQTVRMDCIRTGDLICV